MTIEYYQVPNNESHHQKGSISDRRAAVSADRQDNEGSVINPLQLLNSGAINFGYRVQVDITETARSEHRWLRGTVPYPALATSGSESQYPRCISESRPPKISHQYTTSTPSSAIVHEFRNISVEQLTDTIWRTTSLPTNEKKEEFLGLVDSVLRAMHNNLGEKGLLEDKLRVALCCKCICCFLYPVSRQAFLCMCSLT